MIESMCVVCHGPVAPKRPNKPTAIICNDNGGLCMAAWRRLRKGAPLAPKYTTLRVMHAYRRELLAAEVQMAARLNAGGWLEVG